MNAVLPLDGDARVRRQRASPALLVGLVDREGDELLRPGRHAGLAVVGLLEHQRRVPPARSQTLRSSRRCRRSIFRPSDVACRSARARGGLAFERRGGGRASPHGNGPSTHGAQPGHDEPRHVVVATHGHCFDGLCSAAIIHAPPPPRGAWRRASRSRTISCGYGPGQNGVDPKALAGDVNAILDFRFSPAPQLTWYFDHHVTAFPSDGGPRRATKRAPPHPRRPSAASSTTVPTARARSSSPTSARATSGSTPRRRRASSAGPT